MNETQYLVFDTLTGVKTIGGDYIEFDDGTTIEFTHDQDCCEHNYADLEALDDTGFAESKFILIVAEVVDCGVRLNQYFIPCYSAQNGYYSNGVDMTVRKGGKILFELGIDAEVLEG